MKKQLITLFIMFMAEIASSLPNNSVSPLLQMDTIIPSYTSVIGNGFTFELKINLALGTHGRGLGLNAITSYNSGKGSVSAGLGSTYYLSEIGTGKPGLEIRIFGGGTVNLGNQWGLGYYQTKFISGESSQLTGNIITSYRDCTYLLDSDGGDPDKYRLGVFYFRYKIFRLGTNSESIRHWAQNRLIHDNAGSPQFAIRDRKWRLYGGIYNYNPFTAW